MAGEAAGHDDDHEEVLVAVEPLYLVLLAVLGVRIRWITDPVAEWSVTESVLKEWGW
ncbi:hypothetical protein [Plantactinospora sp. KLBMP9567]|uniref:hypothetical protein n=1 Tax=Plantactinospora sp. KLBMP9567 TaxID=3085900 RepID=UPI002980BD62|nr:hypothetical protein [Plantactinospora sp. KLBMP9567]MDW5325356.1 hypothetical protein [Plantactinospora sp. KLBMP9567]